MTKCSFKAYAFLLIFFSFSCLQGICMSRQSQILFLSDVGIFWVHVWCASQTRPRFNVPSERLSKAQYHHQKGSLSALYNMLRITGTDLYTPESTSTPRGAYKRAAVLALQLRQPTVLSLSLTSLTHFKYYLVNRGNENESHFPRVKRSGQVKDRSTDHRFMRPIPNYLWASSPLN